MKYLVALALIVFAIVVVETDVVVAERAKTSTPSLIGTYKIPEAANPNYSVSPLWWLSSGAYAYIEQNVGRTIIGTLPPHDPWRLMFLASNPTDTDDGYRPQNIFRLVTRAESYNFRQEAYFRILVINMSNSPNRNESNGIHFFNRYQDEHTVYYTGIRVDGFAYIKKKYRGAYTTLSAQRFIESRPYDRASNPNTLPLEQWIGLASEVRTLPDGSVQIDMYVDRHQTGHWEHVASAIDRLTEDNQIISKPGRSGIRTDFMDVQFSDYQIRPLDDLEP